MKNFKLILFSFLLIPSVLNAATAVLEVDTGKENINALETTIHIPSNVLISEVNEGDSAVLFWIESPDYDEESRSISFSGITPGGFQGTRAVLSISGEFTQKDLDKFFFTNIQALRNDGNATVVPVSFSLKFSEISEDVNPPEDFQPLIGQNENIFDGKYFLVFTTQDKGVGVDYYEIREGYFGTYFRVESPYLLRYQSLDKRIFVKVFDRAGNERTVSLKATHPDKWYRFALFAILFIVSASIILAKKLWLKFGN